MGDMSRFEHEVADELGLMAGPEPSVDALAVARSVAAQASKRRLPPMFSALKLMLTIFLLTLTGGLLVAGARLFLDDDSVSIDAPTPPYVFERVTAPTDDPAAHLSDIARHRGTTVVAGVDTAWTSTDGAMTWTGQPLDVRTVVVHDDGFVALGDSAAFHVGSPYWTKVHVSTDGLEWETVATLEGILGKELLSTPDGLALLGLEFRAADGYTGDAGYPTVWYSVDGTDWEAHQVSTPLDDPQELNWNGLSGLARSADGTWLATGSTAIPAEDGGPPGYALHVFYSEDGREWNRTSAPISDVGSEQFAILDHPVWTEAGFLVSAFSTAAMDLAGIHLTTDGSTWEHVAAIPGPEMAAMAAGGSTVLAVQLPPELLGDPVPPAGEPVYESRDGLTFELATPSLLEAGHVDAMDFAADGSVLIAGKDVTGCADAYCIFIPDGGAVPAVWVGARD